MKRYSLEFESDKINNFSSREDFRYSHFYGFASTIKTAKSYISRVKKTYAEDNPRNFRIYDHYADVDPVTDYVPVVYQQD